VGKRMDREETCTRALRPERGDPRATDARSRAALGCARSSRQLVATLGAASLQHGAAGTGAHPAPEPVLAGTAAVVRLVGALHATLLDGTRPWRSRRDTSVGTRCGNHPPRGTNLNRLEAPPRCGNTGPWTRPAQGLLACSSRHPQPGMACPFVHIVWTTVWTWTVQDPGDAGERR
jgi:hypothetical protein